MLPFLLIDVLCQLLMQIPNETFASKPIADDIFGESSAWSV